ncbi:Uncharacterised protein [BD1-7 clade bacterium]|uniref:DUF3817 domain-containing protein n=1 Tax=BD1-7 clade bacterium TaxID=2029982 RepID=A0A5S9PPP7_9GAMM|nr:Uncharacterised protein [BD1-7 clade bacterium]CAA0111429.1 Uncharacterised protein [BD1-7 clade bacterium]CAA0111932.1 Uncharacterised protein [BD1-7 clade bacterium]
MLSTFKYISIIEGLSLIALFLIAMPAKYYFDYPDLIFPVGMTHGILFMIYFVASLAASHIAGWSVMRWMVALVCSVIPFAFIFLDRQLNKDIDASKNGAASA